MALAISAVPGAGMFGRLLSGGFNDPSPGVEPGRSPLDQEFGGEAGMILAVHAPDGKVASDAGRSQRSWFADLGLPAHVTSVSVFAVLLEEEGCSNSSHTLSRRQTPQRWRPWPAR